MFNHFNRIPERDGQMGRCQAIACTMLCMCTAYVSCSDYPQNFAVGTVVPIWNNSRKKPSLKKIECSSNSSSIFYNILVIVLLRCRKPFIPIHHMEAHALIARMTHRYFNNPFICTCTGRFICWLWTEIQFQFWYQQLQFWLLVCAALVNSFSQTFSHISTFS